MTPFIYNATVSRVVDGDTIDIDIDLGFNVILSKRRVRLIGVDTPEKRTRDKREKVFGLLATKVVEKLCPVGSKIIIKTKIDKDDKFGRILGEIIAGDVNVNQYLIDNHYAVKYSGQNKQLVKEAHEQNYNYLIEIGEVTI